MKTMNMFVRIGLSFLVLSLLFSCDNNNDSNPVGETNTHSPVIADMQASSSTLFVNTQTTITCTATDEDGDSLSYSWSASGGSLSAGADSTAAVWEAPDVVGVQTITVTVSDGEHQVADSVSIDVVLGNAPPQITLVEASTDTVVSNDMMSLNCSATDANGDSLAYAWECAWGTFPEGTSSNAVTWEAPRAVVASMNGYRVKFYVTVSDGEFTTRDSCQVLLAEYPFEIRPGIPSVVNTGDSPQVTLRWSHQTTAYDYLIKYDIIVTEGTQTVLDTFVVGSKEVTVNSLDYYGSYTVSPRFHLPEDATQYPESKSFNVGGTAAEQLAINPLAAGDYWVYQVSKWNYDTYEGYSDTTSYLDTCRVVDVSQGTGPDPAASVFTVEGEVFSGIYTFLSDGWYYYDSSSEEWKIALNFRGYPQPQGTMLSSYDGDYNSQSKRVQDVSGVVVTPSQTYSNCYVIRDYSSTSATPGNGASSLDKYHYYAPAYGLVRYNSHSWNEVSPGYVMEGWSDNVLIETNVGP